MEKFVCEKVWNTWFLRKTKMAEIPKNVKHAMSMVACCLKSKEKEKNGESTYFGILSYYDENEDCVIVCSPNKRRYAKITWRGTIQEYKDMWDCD